MFKPFCVLATLLMLTACGGGSSGSGSSNSVNPGGGTSGTTPVILSNFVPVSVDNGPAALNVGPDAYTSDNAAFVSVTLCATGTTNCQVIDHVLVDTGSVGLRIVKSVLSSSLLNALPTQTDSSANPVGECYGFIDGYVFGSVRQADFMIGGETVTNMPFQLIGDTGSFSGVPASCSSGGGTDLNTVQSFGANGVLGIGVTTTDCGTLCQTQGSYSAAIYYDCPSSGCSSIITRTSTTTAPFQQLPNPVAAMTVDNNGTILSLPQVPSGGQATLAGTLYFGIGTQTNNGLGSATVLTTTTSASQSGAGLITVVYKTKSLPESFLDSGSNAYYFTDSTISQCTSDGFTGFYCPTTPISLSPTINGYNGMSASGAFTLYNAQTQFANGFAVQPGIGGDAGSISSFTPPSNSFDYGLPFFYGRNIYTALEGRTAGTSVGPYYAF
jgi:hypothetical protein